MYSDVLDLTDEQFAPPNEEETKVFVFKRSPPAPGPIFDLAKNNPRALQSLLSPPESHAALKFPVYNLSEIPSANKFSSSSSSSRVDAPAPAPERRSSLGAPAPMELDEDFRMTPRFQRADDVPDMPQSPPELSPPNSRDSPPLAEPVKREAAPQQELAHRASHRLGVSPLVGRIDSYQASFASLRNLGSQIQDHESRKAQQQREEEKEAARQKRAERKARKTPPNADAKAAPSAGSSKPKKHSRKAQSQSAGSSQSDNDHSSSNNSSQSFTQPPAKKQRSKKSKSAAAGDDKPRKKSRKKKDKSANDENAPFSDRRSSGAGLSKRSSSGGATLTISQMVFVAHEPGQEPKPQKLTQTVLLPEMTFAPPSAAAASSSSSASASSADIADSPHKAKSHDKESKKRKSSSSAKSKSKSDVSSSSKEKKSSSKRSGSTDKDADEADSPRKKRRVSVGSSSSAISVNHLPPQAIGALKQLARRFADIGEDQAALKAFVLASKETALSVRIALMFNDLSTCFRQPTAAQRKALKNHQKLLAPSSNAMAELDSTLEKTPEDLRQPMAVLFDFSSSALPDQRFMLRLRARDQPAKKWDALDEIEFAVMDLLANERIDKFVFGAKNLLCALLRHFGRMTMWFPLPNLIDTQLAAWLLDPDDAKKSNFDLPDLVRVHVPRQQQLQLSSSSSASSSNNNSNNGNGVAKMLDVDLDAKQSEMAEIRTLESDMDQLPVLWHTLASALDRNALSKTFQEQEMALTVVLSLIEVVGIAFDGKLFAQCRNHIKDKLKGLEKQAKDIAGRPFLLSSPEQVADILYNKLKCPKIAETKGGRSKAKGEKHHSTAEGVLKQLIPYTPLAAIVLEYRHIHKVLTTYMDPMINHARSPFPSRFAMAKTSRIYSSWNQMSTGTGRLSASRPNLQSLPKRAKHAPANQAAVSSSSNSSQSQQSQQDAEADDDADDTQHSKDTIPAYVNVRDAFQASDDTRELLSADYSQMEMRILAQCSRDQALINIFNSASVSPSEGKSPRTNDVYKLMASQCFNVPIERVTKEERDKAKTISLGIVYGMGPKNLASQLMEDSKTMTEATAKNLIEAWHRRFSGVRSFINRTHAQCKINGYVSTIAHRRRWLPDIKSPVPFKRSYAERQSVNTIIQGSASDMMKMAMLRIQSALNSTAAKRRDDPNGRPRVQIVLQLHDEIVLEVDKSVFAETCHLVRRCMEGVLPDSVVPFPVNIKRGHSLGSLTPVTLSSPTGEEAFARGYASSSAGSSSGSDSGSSTPPPSHAARLSQSAASMMAGDSSSSSSSSASHSAIFSAPSSASAMLRSSSGPLPLSSASPASASAAPWLPEPMSDVDDRVARRRLSRDLAGADSSPPFYPTPPLTQPSQPSFASQQHQQQQLSQPSLDNLSLPTLPPSAMFAAAAVAAAGPFSFDESGGDGGGGADEGDDLDMLDLDYPPAFSSSSSSASFAAAAEPLNAYSPLPPLEAPGPLFASAAGAGAPISRSLSSSSFADSSSSFVWPDR